MAVVQPQGGGITLVIFVCLFLPLTIIATVFRIWARRLKRKQLEINDYAAIIATVLAVANAILTLLAVILGGVGQHLADVLPEAQTLAKITLALALVWTLANTAVKLSILHFYITIFRTRTFRYAAYVVMALTAGYAITNLTQLLLICRPVVFNWDKTIVGGTCSTEETPFLASACINMSIDVIIVVLPMPMLWRLQMPTQKKVALSGIFGIGALICILSAIRINAIATIDYSDFSYSVVPDGVYSVLEPCLGVINASLPVLQPVANKLSNSKLFSFVRSTIPGRSTNQKQKSHGNIWSGPRTTEFKSQGFQPLNEETGLNDDIPLRESRSPSQGRI